MPLPGLGDNITDESTYARAIEQLRQARVLLPTFAQLADPSTVPGTVKAALGGAGPDEAHPLNLFRMHWYNGADRMSPAAVPAHVVLGSELTGVPAQVVVALATVFP